MIRLDLHTPKFPDIKPFTAMHLPGALALSQAVRWPHRLEDWALGFSVSEGVVAIERGRVVATALCSFHGPVATLNMIIVDEAMRGRGVGRKIMERIIALAGPREMRLIATAEGEPLYRKLGFAPTGGIVQVQGLASAAPPERPVRIGPESTEAMARMDHAASGMERAPLLARIAGMGTTLTTEGGFALLRPFGRGHVLGPVVARDATAARSLIAAAASRQDGQFLRMDLPGDHGLVPFAESLGLSVAGGGTAMVQAPRARPDTEFQTYALISQALG